MNRAMAWNFAGVDRRTRDAAVEAARRAGMRLDDWLDEAIAEPKPVQERLPLLVGSTGPKMLRVAARHADIWHGYAPDAEAFASLYREFLEACELEGRDPGEVVRAAGGPIVTASATVIAERLRAGVQLFVVTTQAPFDADTIRRVATEEWPRALELAGLEP